MQVTLGLSWPSGNRSPINLLAHAGPGVSNGSTVVDSQPPVFHTRPTLADACKSWKSTRHRPDAAEPLDRAAHVAAPLGASPPRLMGQRFSDRFSSSIYIYTESGRFRRAHTAITTATLPGPPDRARRRRIRP